MTRKLTRVGAATVVVALGLTSGCGGGTKSSTNNAAPAGNTGYNAAATDVVNASTAKGGTLNLWTSQDADSWDPVRTYYAFVWNLNRLYTRNLLTYEAKVGAEGLKLAPDLAAALPQVAADGKTYTFTLRDGLKYDDGSPITAQDVKYGIERVFAQDVVPGGPVYLIEHLDQGQNYPGPYKDTDPAKLGLRSVETPDDKTIVFKLAKPFVDFQYLLAMPGAGPVPRARDTGAQYGAKPASSGPYMIESYAPGKSLAWVRNPNWSQESDPIRKALPDKINLTITTNQSDLDSRLLAGTADLDVGQSGLEAAARAKVLQDPKLKANADAPVNGAIDFAAISSKVPPLDNVECRKAVLYAADPTAMQSVLGGPVGGGDIGTNMLPPNLLGADPAYDPYGRSGGKPQVDKAKAALVACGKPTGFKTVIAVRNNGEEEVKAGEALQASLKAVGIDAAIDQYDGAQAASVVGSPDNVHKKGYGILFNGWVADWPSGTGFLQPLADSRFLLDNGNVNLAEVADPKIDALFDQAAAATDPSAAAAFYKQANQAVMEGAYYLPVVFAKGFNYRHPRLTNVYFHNALGMVDFQALGVSDGK